MDREMEKLINKLSKGMTVKCRIGRDYYSLEGYNIMHAIDILGLNGANPKTKEALDKLFFGQLKEKFENTGFKGRALANSSQELVFEYEEIYNKLFAYGLVEFYYNEHDDVEKLKLNSKGVELYKEWKKNYN